MAKLKNYKEYFAILKKDPSEFHNFLEAGRESIEVEANKSIIAPSRSSCPKANNKGAPR